MLLFAISAAIAAPPVQFAIARVTQDRKVCVEVRTLANLTSKPNQAYTYQLPPRLMNSVYPSSAPPSPTYTGPRIEGMRCSSRRFYVYASLRDWSAEKIYAPSFLVIEFDRATGANRSKSLSMPPGDPETFLDRYRNARESQPAEALAKVIASPRGPTYPKEVVSKAEAIKFSNLAWQRGLRPYFSSYERPRWEYDLQVAMYAALSAKRDAFVVFGELASEGQFAPFVLNKASRWKPIMLSSKWKGIRSAQIWEQHAVIGTSEDEVEVYTKPFLEFFDFNGKRLAVLPGNLFLGL